MKRAWVSCFDTKYMTQQHPQKIGWTKRWWHNLTWIRGAKCCKDKCKSVLVVWDFEVAHRLNAFFSPMFTFAFYHSLQDSVQCLHLVCLTGQPELLGALFQLTRTVGNTQLGFLCVSSRYYWMLFQSSTSFLLSLKRSSL